MSRLHYWWRKFVELVPDPEILSLAFECRWKCSAKLMVLTTERLEFSDWICLRFIRTFHPPPHLAPHLGIVDGCIPPLPYKIRQFRILSLWCGFGGEFCYGSPLCVVCDKFDYSVSFPYFRLFVHVKFMNLVSLS